jgi:hypothetical protein
MSKKSKQKFLGYVGPSGQLIYLDMSRAMKVKVNAKESILTVTFVDGSVETLEVPSTAANAVLDYLQESGIISDSTETPQKPQIESDDAEEHF